LPLGKTDARYETRDVRKARVFLGGTDTGNTEHTVDFYKSLRSIALVLASRI